MITKEWVIISTERAKRPQDFKSRQRKRSHSEYSESCPFCPGNEAKTPEEVFRVSDGDQWKMRLIPNKFAALQRNTEGKRFNEGLKHVISGFGVHDVLIEARRHNMTTALFPPEHIADILRTYKKRFIELHDDNRIGHVIIFKNHGEGAGTSIQHPHSQIIGTPVTPFQIRRRIEESINFFDLSGECLTCRIMAEERNEGTRIIHETEHFVAFIPYAALSAFHTWIFPKRHSGTFSEITEEEIKDLSLNLKTVLSRLYYGLNDPDFNYVVRSNRPRDAGSESHHWYLSVVPRISTAAGFEMGSGMFINSALPEESAKFLREVLIPQ